MPPESACPPLEHLRALRLGLVEEPAIAAITEHLEGCPACLQRLESVPVQTDPLLRTLRSLPNDPPPDLRALRVRLMNLVRP